MIGHIWPEYVLETRRQREAPPLAGRRGE